jgi:acyl-coenzyme A synthetase/AMP-(fatty) acid ligase
VNFARDLLEAQPPDRRALVELSREGERRGWTFAEVAAGCERMSVALTERGVGRGDVVMTLIGNRPDWVLTMMACFRIGAVALPCTEQLRAKDIVLRLTVAEPRLIVSDVRNREQLERAHPGCGVLWIGQRHEPDGDVHVEKGGHSRTHTRVVPRANVEDAPSRPIEPAPPYAELAPEEPALITFTSGTSGEPKAVVHGQRYLHGQRVQAEHWLGPRKGELVWCTASSGWSKSARNVFIAPWLCGAAALLHDARFDPSERLEVIEREQVSVLCMAPTEYRVIAKRAELRPLPSLRAMVAAGEALNPEVLNAWREATGLDICDGYGQTETGQMTGMPADSPARAGSMGRALPGMTLTVQDGELVADPRTVPTFFLGYLGEGVRRRDAVEAGAVDARAASVDAVQTHTADTDTVEAHSPSVDALDTHAAGADATAPNAADRLRGSSVWEVRDRRDGGPWHTGDRVTEDEDGYLFFEGRSDDVIISAGYRIGPFEVESALVAHPAVAEAAAVAAPDEERGSVVRAIVVLRDGHAPSDELAHELQEHVKRDTAPYKYPRIVEFAEELPKTASGKIRRAELRSSAS